MVILVISLVIRRRKVSEKYLLATPHGWYFRRAVPKFLQPIFGKTVLKKPLKTATFTEAKAEARYLVADSEKLFQKLRDSMSDPRTWPIGFTLSKASIDHSGNVTVEGLQMDPDKIEAETAALRSFMETLKCNNAKAGNTLRLSDAIEQFIAEKSSDGSWSGKTKDEIQAALDLITEILGNQSISELTRENALSVRETLTKLPINRSKDPLYRDKSVAQILKMRKPEQCLSTASVNKCITRASALWEWALQFNYVNSNIFKNMQLKTGKATRDLRERFTSDQVKLLLANLDHSAEDRYWITYIAAYSGMRLNEICQLDTKDIVCKDNVYSFSINADGNNKKLKTLSSKRLVPIHDQLVYLGFLKYVESRKNSTKLFPDLKFTKNGFGDAISKWFGRYRQKLGFAKDGPDFHSFRHTVADSLKQLRVDQTIIEDILGHSGNNRSATATTYTNRFEQSILKIELNKLTY